MNIEVVTLSETTDHMNVDSSNEKQSPRVNTRQADDSDHSSRRQSIAVSHRRHIRKPDVDRSTEFFGFPNATWNETKDVYLQRSRYK